MGVYIDNSLLETRDDILDYQYESCKKHERKTNYIKCESCKNRFVCWTRKYSATKYRGS